MKKITVILLCITCFLALGSCDADENSDGDKLQITCTSHVVANWVENLIDGADDCAKVTVLADEGKDMHNFQPSAADMREIYKSDLLIYIGGESDKWVDEMDTDGKKTKILRLMDSIDGEHCDGCLDGHDHHHEEAPDEHIWLSFENARKCVKVIFDALCELDTKNSAVYGEQLESYCAELDALYGEYKTAVKNAKYKTLVFADRFPFVYLLNELGLEYCAAFPGCSSETSASFETVVMLAKKVDELSLPCVLTIESSKEGIAETVVENTAGKNAQILSLDSMQIYHGDSNFDYITVMKENLNVFKIALGE